jgi:alcohol dehydrogenase (cytochrome c)
VLDAVEAVTGKYLFSLDAGVQNFITRIDPVTGAKTIDPKLIPVPGEEKIRTVCPNWIGVKNWLPGAINPNTKVAFIAGNESCMDLEPVSPGDTAALTSGVMPKTRPVPNSDGRYGRMQAFDLQNRKVLWTERQHAPMTSGVLATAGGVVFSGALDQMFSAYDEKTGKKLWGTRLSDVPSSTPIAYTVDDKQYVAVVVGFGSLHSTGFIQLVPDIALPTRPSSSIYVFALP